MSSVRPHSPLAGAISPTRRRRADLGHRQLRRHLHPGVPGRQGCRPEPGAYGLLGLVGLDRSGRDRAGPELGRARAHHHRLVDPGRRLPGDGAGHHALRRGGGRLPGVGCGLRAAGPVGLVRARDPADPAGRGGRAAGRHPAAIRHPGFWRRERGSGAGRPVDRGLCDPQARHRALCGGWHPGAGPGLPAVAAARRPERAGAARRRRCSRGPSSRSTPC